MFAAPMLELRRGTIGEGLAAGLEDLLFLNHDEAGEPGPLTINWPAYRQFERLGCLFPFYLFSGNLLVGYNVFFVQPHLHNTAAVWAINDMVYVEPEARRGWAGVKLIRDAEAPLRAAGACRIVYHVRPERLAKTTPRASVAALLTKCGYGLAEEAYAKAL